MKSYSFKNYGNQTKYDNAKKYVEKLKDEVKLNYVNGQISEYKMADIINDLDYLVDNLNNQFLNMKRFEIS
jgi:molybdopterin/thiamine biosynthesis adenylyltransferase